MSAFIGPAAIIRRCAQRWGAASAGFDWPQRSGMQRVKAQFQPHFTGGRPSFGGRNCPVSGNRGLTQNLALGTSVLRRGGPKRGMMLSPALHVARGGSPLRWGTSVS